MATIYRAEWLLPISAPPVRNGAVAVDGERIVAVGTLPRGARRLRRRQHGRLRPGRAAARFRERAQPPRVHELPRHVRRPAVRRLDHHLVDVKASLTPDEYLWSARLGALEALVLGRHDHRRHHLHRRDPDRGGRGRPARRRLPRGLRHRRQAPRRDAGRPRASAWRGPASRPARASRSVSRRTPRTPCRAACSRRSPASPASAT